MHLYQYFYMKVFNLVSQLMLKVSGKPKPQSEDRNAQTGLETLMNQVF